ncbi:MAG: glycosyltransferase [Pseudomonadota bacterium]
MKELTVIMPVYNAERYLSAAIESVLGQTYKHFKFIIINDGSTDRSGDIIDQYKALDSRILALSQPNSGISQTRNRGLEAAQTEWVALMDADDIMLPERLEQQLAFIEKHTNIRVASCRAIYIDENDNELGRSVCHIKTPDDLNRLLTQNQPIGLLNPGVLMHRQTILDLGGYRSQFRVGEEDIDLWTRVAEQGHLILIQDATLMKYRLHSESIVSSPNFQNLMGREWVRACMSARKEGKPEPSYEKFLQQWNSAPLLTRLNRKRKMMAIHLYRRAGLRLVGRRWFKGGCELGLATLLEPIYVFSRLKMQMLR